MFDIQKIKTVLDNEISNREKASTQLFGARCSGDELRISFCENRYQKLHYKVEGMKEMLFEMGYIVLELDSGVLLLERADIDIQTENND